jgi:hypothetical protein
MTRNPRFTRVFGFSGLRPAVWRLKPIAAVEEIRPGDVVWFPPGERHWHGATATTAMTHIAIQQKPDGKAVNCMEKVTDSREQPPGLPARLGLTVR